MSKTLRRHNQRPPRDPSAATRPKNALEQAAMTSFRQKVQQANATSICNSTNENVGRMPMRKLLAMDRFCVPIFQRRYCWTETQWRTLLQDAAKHQPLGQHSLGRLTCTAVSDTASSSSLVGVEGRSCILDGQQRFTTVTLLLAAIRDCLIQQQEGNAFAGTIDSIHSLLFLDPTRMQEWRRSNQELGEGAELDFARLIPTFCDRWSYYSAILPNDPSSDNDTKTPLLHLPRPLQAKQFFLQTLQTDYTTIPQLTRLLRGVLDGLTMLYFPVDVGTNYQDGTDDLMVIYERLALRDATFCKPTRQDEYQSMDGSDMIRNLLLGSFDNDTDALAFYKDYWLPLEQWIVPQVGNSAQQKTVAKILRAFLDAQNKGDEEVSPNRNGIIGGRLYADFQVWFARKLALRSDLSVEDKVRGVGQELLDFARF